MALTIRMRIDDNDEHQYYYATGSGTEIELIPLVVTANGDYVPDEGKAYNRVTVNVPSTELETLIVNTNGTYNAPDGKAYNVVQVDVQSIINLQNKSASYTANGNYTIQADSGYDGLDTVSVAVNVPTPTPQLQSKTETYTANGEYRVSPDNDYDGLSEVDVEVNVPTSNIQPYKQETITQNGTVTVSPDSGYDAMEEAEITVNVPTGGNVQNFKQVTYNQNGYYQVTPDTGYDGIATVGIGIEVPTGGGGGNVLTGDFTPVETDTPVSLDIGLPSGCRITSLIYSLKNYNSFKTIARPRAVLGETFYFDGNTTAGESDGWTTSIYRTSNTGSSTSSGASNTAVNTDIATTGSHLMSVNGARNAVTYKNPSDTSLFGLLTGQTYTFYATYEEN